jgi:uncharacterized membrane protein YbhN (UPF0104 family)
MKVWARAAVSLGLLALLFAFLPWHETRDAFRKIPLALWVAILTGFILGHMMGVVKWRMLVNRGSVRLGMADAVRAYSAGLFTNICLPGIVGGDVIRATLAARRMNRAGDVIAAGIVDRAIDVASLALVAAIGGIFVGRTAAGPVATGIGIAAGTSAVVAVLFGVLMARRPLSAWPRRFRRPIGRTLAALRRLSSQPSTILACALLSIAMQVWFVALNIFIGQSLGIDVAVAVWVFTWSLAKVAALVPISLGGLAVRDAAFAALIAPFGVPITIGVVASLVWQSIVIAGGLVAGALSQVLGGDPRSALRLGTPRRPIVDASWRNSV